MYSEYKATREKMPEEMAETIPRMMQALTTLQMNLMEKDGYEADDIIATIARKCASASSRSPRQPCQRCEKARTNLAAATNRKFSTGSTAV